MTTFDHSAFTPSTAEAETLESLFVARERLARSVVDGVVVSATSDNKHQRLLIGPRGIGKTHFVSLIYHRIKARAELQDRLRIAWLPEDCYIAGYPPLLLQILKRLADEHGLDEQNRAIEGVLNLEDPDKREAALQRLLEEALGSRTLLLIVENLDKHLQGLGEQGQHKLRAFIQNRRSVTILATTTSLTDDLTERDKTFFGFFMVSELKPFGVEEAQQFLVKLAERVANGDLADTLRSALGMARIRAVHHLAGGNPRIYFVFYDLLTQGSLYKLSQSLTKLVDRLTPYYQERMERLPIVLQSIIGVLSGLEGATTAKEIARQTMRISTEIVQGTERLEELGYVVKVAVGASEYYELREPLMRICLNLKERHGRRLELLAQFLCAWYPERELDQLASHGAVDGDMKQIYEAAQLAKRKRTSLALKFEEHRFSGNHETLLDDAEAELSRDPNQVTLWRKRAESLEKLERDLPSQLECWQRVVELDPSNIYAWSKMDCMYSSMGRFKESLEASRKAVELSPENLVLLENYGWALKAVGDSRGAEEYFSKCLSISPITANDWSRRGNQLRGMVGRAEESLAAHLKAVMLEPIRLPSWSGFLGLLQYTGRYKRLYEISASLVRWFPNEAIFYSYLGTALSDLERYEEALIAYDQALAVEPGLDKKDEPVSLYRAITLLKLQRNEEGEKSLANYVPISNRWKAELEMAWVVFEMHQGRWMAAQERLDRLLQDERLVAHLKNGESDFGVMSALKNEADSKLWPYYVDALVGSFRKNDLISDLGFAFLNGLRVLRFSSVGDDTARAWHNVWKVHVGEIVEMELPLRLFEAGVEYRATHDARALLALPLEERSLLEPWFTNMVEGNDEIDRTLGMLVPDLEHRVMLEKRAKQREAFWTSPAPEFGELDFEGLLIHYDRISELSALRILPGGWKTLDRESAAVLLRDAATQHDHLRRAWARPGLRVVGVEERTVSFGELHVVHVGVEESGRNGAVDLLRLGREFFVISGTSGIFYDLVESGVIRLDTEEACSEFVRFFCGGLRGADGRFQIVEHVSDLEPISLIDPATLPPIDQWKRLKETPHEEHCYTGTIVYGGTLFRAKFKLSQSVDRKSIIEMFEDEPLAGNVVRKEDYDGIVRFVEIA